MFDYDTSVLYNLTQRAGDYGFTSEYIGDTGMFLSKLTKRHNIFIWVKRKPNVQFYHVNVIVTRPELVIVNENIISAYHLVKVLMEHYDSVRSYMSDVIISDEELIELYNEFMEDA